MWHEVKGVWDGEAAAHMYKVSLSNALRNRYPGFTRKWRVMEDNDPAGYKSRVALADEVAANIATVEMPPRSPDLNPLDFSVWSEINRKMREQEAS